MGMLLHTTVCICGEQGKLWYPGLMFPPPWCSWSPLPPWRQTPPTLWHRKCPQSLLLEQRAKSAKTFLKGSPTPPPPSWVEPARNAFTASDIREVLDDSTTLDDFCLGLILLTCKRSRLQVTFFSGRPVRLSKFSCSTSMASIFTGTFLTLPPPLLTILLIPASLFMSSMMDASTRCWDGFLRWKCCAALLPIPSLALPELSTGRHSCCLDCSLGLSQSLS